ncbi:metabotropic glycine receptor-like [Littorina saxatilis]|uniref:metabotropic glycine receptor-like n=1 Tax=Littorina saxatilis TaxID=31220 RepID=UPI0038B67E37
MAMKTTRRRPAVFGEWWWIRTTRCFLYLLLSFFLFLSSSSPLFCLLLLPNPPTASAIAFPDSDSGYSNRGGGNYSIFSYHLPESEDDFADVEDSTNMEDDWFGNDTMPWPEDDVTDSPLSSMDHVGDGLRNAEIIDDIDEEETGEEEKAGGEEGHSYGHEGEDADKEKGEEETAKDVVQQFLEEVERYENNKANCTAGTSHNLGKGVIKQYGLNRFKAQALVAVNRANFLTRIWKNGNPAILTSEYFFYTQVRSMLEGDSEIFAAGNCYDKRQFKDYYLFCPFAYRTASGLVNVKDLSVEYDYLAGNGSEWFETCRFKASRSHNVTLGTVQWRYNQSLHMEKENDTVVTVDYEDGHWSLPYFDCGGGDIWMMTYTVPFFAYNNGTPFFKGTSGIDIDLQKVDIDQCPLTDSKEENVFAGSHKCKIATTRVSTSQTVYTP